LKFVITIRRLALLAVVCSVGLASVCALASTASASSLRLSSAERAVVELINQTRAQHGLLPVQVRTSLCRAARAHSREMVRRGFFSHQSHGGGSPTARMVRYGYGMRGCSSWSTGEVLAYGSGPAGSAQAIVNGWLRSPLHRALLLRPGWRDVGVGRACGTFLGIRRTAVYTVDLGRRTL